MKVLNLRCAHYHRFEGWFASDADYVTQGEQGLVNCPLCGNTDVQRLPSAPRLSLSGVRQEEPLALPGLQDVQARWLRAIHHMLKRTEDVGERFAEEARRIHYGEVKERGIRGRATHDEAEALVEEGIQVMSVPVPAALNGTVQ
jgi:hypothetical protein